MGLRPELMVPVLALSACAQVRVVPAHSEKEAGVVAPRLIETSCAQDGDNPPEAIEKHWSAVIQVNYVVSAAGVPGQISIQRDLPELFTASVDRWIRRQS